MARGFHIAQYDTEFKAMWTEVASCIEPKARLPTWPFLAAQGHADFTDWYAVLHGQFAPVLEALMNAHGDKYCTLAVLDPEPEYFRDAYAFLAAMQFQIGTLDSSYWDGISFRPGGDPTGAIAESANVVGIVGSTRGWAVWATRSWGLALVLSSVVCGPWTATGMFVPAEVAVAELVQTSWRVPLPEQDIAEFLAAVQERGTVQDTHQ